MSDLNITPSATAVVLIDLQGAIVSRDPKPHPAADVIAHCRQIADAYRAAGATIVFVHVDFNNIIELPADEAMQRPPQKLPDAAIDIVPEAGKKPGDLLITKRHWGAFAGTPLEQELRSRNITTIILAGIATNVGVESTLRQGTGLGFHFITVEDACSNLTAEGHEFAIKNAFPRLSKVRSTEQVLAAIA